MKLIHLSDLHLGKRVNEFSMLEDQRYVLDRCLEEGPAAIDRVIDIVNEAQRRFIKSYKDIHETIQNVPNTLYESELMEQIDKETELDLPTRMPQKPVDIDEEIGDLDEEFDLFVHKFTTPKE